MNHRLSRVILLALILITNTAPVHAGQEQQGFFPASANAIHYLGRTQRNNGVLWTWPGSGLRVSYSNSRAISVRFRAPDYPDDSTRGWIKVAWYRVDDNPWLMIVMPPNTVADYGLYAPSDRGKHTLEIVKASEGQVIFEGITLEPGGRLAKPPIAPHRIEFVGDSITAGYKMKGNGSFESAMDHDAKASFGWLVGERLNAEVRLIAVTGRGLVHDYGMVRSTSLTLPLTYPYLHRESTLPNDWTWKPEIIVVNVGTNDLGPPEPTASAAFQDAYNNFLSVIRGYNPGALIVALQPFGVGNGSVQVYPAEIRAAVEARRQAGDSRVVYADTMGWLGAGDYTDGAHPNVSGHQKAAERLAAILQPALGGK